MSANDRQVGGQHYNSEFQHWDWIELINLPRLVASTTKYLTRWKKKNGLQDLEKSSHYLDKFIELEHERHEQVLLMTQNFLRLNDIGTEERAVVNMLVNYVLGDGDRLLAAAAGIQRLIAAEKKRLEEADVTNE